MNDFGGSWKNTVKWTTCWPASSSLHSGRILPKLQKHCKILYFLSFGESSVASPSPSKLQNHYKIQYFLILFKLLRVKRGEPYSVEVAKALKFLIQHVLDSWELGVASSMRPKLQKHCKIQYFLSFGEFSVASSIWWKLQKHCKMQCFWSFGELAVEGSIVQK